MKKLLFLMFALAMYQGASAQEVKSNTETVIIKTSAQCGDCKERIEGVLNYTKGVKFSELDLETMNVTVKFSSSKITLQQIKEKISSIGYDADEVKSNPAAVKKLPACCQPAGMKN